MQFKKKKNSVSRKWVGRPSTEPQKGHDEGKTNMRWRSNFAE